jgi:hypothetical protein
MPLSKSEATIFIILHFLAGYMPYHREEPGHPDPQKDAVSGVRNNAIVVLTGFQKEFICKGLWDGKLSSYRCWF